MKNFLLSIALILSHIFLAAQCPPGDLLFSSQAQIDDFGANYPNCTDFDGTITISGGVTNLNGLSALNSIGGDLNFLYNTYLSNMTGLTNLTSIGGNLNIHENYTLINLLGMNSLSSVGGYLYINRNNLLLSITGLNGLTSVGGGISISESAGLTNVLGLSSLATVEGDFEIINCPSLTNLTGLDNLVSIGGYCVIQNNEALASLEGLNGLTSIGGELTIRSNYELTSLSGLDNIDAGTIDDLNIYSNFLLSTCEVLSICNYLASPGGSILINNNASGCETQEEVEIACEWVSVDELNQEDDLLLYPNPAHSVISVETSFDTSIDAILSISNTSGQKIITQQINDSKTNINIAELPTGIYIVQIQSGAGIVTQKLLVNK